MPSSSPSPRRILVVTPPDFAFHCGISANLDGLLTAIAEKTSFCFDRATKANARLFSTRHPLSDRSLTVRSPTGLKNVYHAAQKADLVWLHDTGYAGAIAAFRGARKAKKPILTTQHHGVAPFPSFCRRSLGALTSRWITEPILKQSARVTFTSDSVAEHYYRRMPFTAPVAIVPNGVDTAQFCPAPPDRRRALRARASLRDDQPVLLFADRFTASAGLLVIRALAKQMPRWRFWVSGDGPLDPAAWFLPNVQVFRNPDAATRLDLYHATDLLILPGYGTLVPSALQEAIASGLPVMGGAPIAANIPAAKPCLIVAPVDPASAERTGERWAKELKKAYDSPPLTTTSADMARLAESLWSLPVIADYYGHLLAELLPATR